MSSLREIDPDCIDAPLWVAPGQMSMVLSHHVNVLRFPGSLLQALHYPNFTMNMRAIYECILRIWMETLPVGLSSRTRIKFDQDYKSIALYLSLSAALMRPKHAETSRGYKKEKLYGSPDLTYGENQHATQEPPRHSPGIGPTSMSLVPTLSKDTTAHPGLSGQSHPGEHQQRHLYSPTDDLAGYLSLNQQRLVSTALNGMISQWLVGSDPYNRTWGNVGHPHGRLGAPNQRESTSAIQSLGSSGASTSFLQLSTSTSSRFVLQAPTSSSQSARGGIDQASQQMQQNIRKRRKAGF